MLSCRWFVAGLTPATYHSYLSTLSTFYSLLLQLVAAPTLLLSSYKTTGPNLIEWSFPVALQCPAACCTACVASEQLSAPQYSPSPFVIECVYNLLQSPVLLRSNTTLPRRYTCPFHWLTICYALLLLYDALLVVLLSSRTPQAHSSILTLSEHYSVLLIPVAALVLLPSRTTLYTQASARTLSVHHSLSLLPVAVLVLIPSSTIPWRLCNMPSALALPGALPRSSHTD